MVGRKQKPEKRILTRGQMQVLHLVSNNPNCYCSQFDRMIAELGEEYGAQLMPSAHKTLVTLEELGLLSSRTPANWKGTGKPRLYKARKAGLECLNFNLDIDYGFAESVWPNRESGEGVEAAA